MPQGEIKGPFEWKSEIFPGTVREYWVYVPAQYDGSKPACVFILQDGLRRAQGWKIPTVLDNLIHKGEAPVQIGIFISPGVVPAPRENAQPRFNRSFEYDGLGDRYARFLIEEIIPEVSKTYRLSADPNDRAIGGASSGAICAFTAAWERPDQFRRVLSTIGTYVSLRGGNEYPVLIRKYEPKPLRVFLQDGTRDLNLYGGDWWMANQTMLSALKYSGYEVTHAWGEGGHNSKHSASIMPDAVRWLWQGYPLDRFFQQPPRVDVANGNIETVVRPEATGGITVYAYEMGPYWNDGLAPRFYPERAAAKIRNWIAHKVKGIYWCGGGENWGAVGPTYYVIGRLATDPTLARREVYAEYLDFTFRDAAPAMRQYYDALYRRLSQFRDPKNDTMLVGTRDGQLLNYKHTYPHEMWTTIYPLETLDELQSYLDKAGNDERAQGWIRVAQISYDQYALIARMFHETMKFRGKGPKPRSKDLLRQSAEAYYAWVDETLKLNETDPDFTKNFIHDCSKHFAIWSDYKFLMHINGRMHPYLFEKP